MEIGGPKESRKIGRRNEGGGDWFASKEFNYFPPMPHFKKTQILRREFPRAFATWAETWVGSPDSEVSDFFCSLRAGSIVVRRLEILRRDGRGRAVNQLSAKDLAAAAAVAECRDGDCFRGILFSPHDNTVRFSARF